jgi:hypothetical protein
MIKRIYWKRPTFLCCRLFLDSSDGMSEMLNLGHRHLQIGRMLDSDLISDLRLKGVDSLECRTFSKNQNQRLCPLLRRFLRSKVVNIDVASCPYHFIKTKAMSSTWWVEGRRSSFCPPLACGLVLQPYAGVGFILQSWIYEFSPRQ